MSRWTLLAFGSVLFAGCSSSIQSGTVASSAAAGAAHSFDREVAPLLATYCTGCHSGPNAPEGINLSFANEEEARQKAATDDEFWSRVVRNASSGQMPPPYAQKKPTD